ncbi:MAG TPA: SCO family protein [Burkholderiales bacterium]|nr:SCO family protein [Burkholderiales bacterium]
MKHQHGVNARAVALIIAAFAAMVALVAAAAFGVTRWWNVPQAGANTAVGMRIAGPVLESAPGVERERYFAEKDALLRRYDWIDREQGVARIPIDDAMKIMAGEAKTAAAAPDIKERLGEPLPLDVAVVDEQGREAPLSRYFGRVPVALVFGWYDCRTLCTTMMESVLVAASASSLPSDGYRVVGVSIDPRETSADAARKAASYRTAHGSVPLALLTARAPSIERLTRASGVSYRYDPDRDDFRHPLAVIVAGADGRIARYVPGVAVEPRDLRLALVDAAQGRIGTLAERIYLRCAHYDPVTGRYSVRVMAWVRALAVLTAVALGVWIWRRRSRP